MLSWGVCLCVVAGGLQAMEGARVDWSVLEVRGEVMGAQAGAAAQRGPAVKAREDGEATCVVRSGMRGPMSMTMSR